MIKTKDIDITAVGAIVVDNIFLVDEIPAAGLGSMIRQSGVYFGGRAPNVAVIGAKLGLTTSIVSAIGFDFKEVGYLDFLTENRVITEGLVESKNRRTDKTYLFTPKDQRQISFVDLDAYYAFEEMEVPNQLLARTKIVHISSGNPEYNLKAAKQYKSLNTMISFDVGNDVYLHSDGYLKEMLGLANFLFMNQTERNYLEKRIGKDFLEAVAASDNLELLGLMGENREVTVYSEGKEFRVEAPQVEIIDRTGASDGFAAGVLTGYIKGFSIQDSVALGHTIMKNVLRKVGALTNIPSIDDLKSQGFKV